MYLFNEILHQKWKWKSLSHVWLFATPWTTQSVGFSRPEYWSGEPFPSPGDLPNPGIEPRSPALQVDSLPAEPQGKPKILNSCQKKKKKERGRCLFIADLQDKLLTRGKKDYTYRKKKKSIYIVVYVCLSNITALQSVRKKVWKDIHDSWQKASMWRGTGAGRGGVRRQETAAHLRPACYSLCLVFFFF